MSNTTFGSISNERIIKLKEGQESMVRRASSRVESRYPSPTNLFFHDSHVSKIHGAIRFKDNQYQLVDYDSTFGTVLNNHFILPNVWFYLQDSDVIGFVMAKPSPTIDLAVDKWILNNDSNEKMIPLKEFGYPKIHLTFKVSIINDSIKFVPYVYPRVKELNRKPYSSQETDWKFPGSRVVSDPINLPTPATTTFVEIVDLDIVDSDDDDSDDDDVSKTNNSNIFEIADDDDDDDDDKKQGDELADQNKNLDLSENRPHYSVDYLQDLISSCKKDYVDNTSCNVVSEFDEENKSEKGDRIEDSDNYQEQENCEVEDVVADELSSERDDSSIQQREDIEVVITEVEQDEVSDQDASEEDEKIDDNDSEELVHEIENENEDDDKSEMDDENEYEIVEYELDMDSKCDAVNQQSPDVCPASPSVYQISRICYQPPSPPPETMSACEFCSDDYELIDSDRTNPVKTSKRPFYEMDGYDDDEEDLDAEVPRTFKRARHDHSRAKTVAKEVGKGLLYALITVAAIGAYGSTIASQSGI